MWFNRIKHDMSLLPDMIEYYTQEAEHAKSEVKIKGSLEKNAQDLPGQVTHRFSQLQEIEAVLKHMHVKYDKMRSDHYRRYLERYNRELTDRSIEKYIDGESDIVDMCCLINEVALVRNLFLAITKGQDAKNYQLGHIVKLRIAGMNDQTL